MVSSHVYIPSPGQADAEERAQTLGLPLGTSDLAGDYGNPALPCAVCDHDGTVVVTPEPTTFEEVWAAHDTLVATANRFLLDVNEAGNLLTITVMYADGEAKSGTVSLV